jgi:hypothetical protein
MDDYQQVMTPYKPWCWWVFSKMNVGYTRKCSELLKLTIGSSIHEIDVSRDMCFVCGETVTHKGMHIVFECEYLNEVRCEKYEEIQQVLPPALLQSLDEMNMNQKFQFFASGFNDTIIPEWDHLYQVVLKLVSYMYHEYIQVLDNSL